MVAKEIFEKCTVAMLGVPCGLWIKIHVRGFFDTDLHKVSWHFATHEAVRPSGFEVQLTECICTPHRGLQILGG